MIHATFKWVIEDFIEGTESRRRNVASDEIAAISRSALSWEGRSDDAEARGSGGEGERGSEKGRGGHSRRFGPRTGRISLLDPALASFLFRLWTSEPVFRLCHFLFCSVDDIFIRYCCDCACINIARTVVLMHSMSFVQSTRWLEKEIVSSSTS